MLRNFLLVGLGGSVGCMARYGVALLAGRWYQQHFPLATFIINLSGCFLIGLIYGFLQRQQPVQNDMWLLLATGLCGGFTTFSAFALEGNLLFQKQLNVMMVAYMVMSVLFGLLLCRAGMLLAK